jgi:hypothetical protein
MAVFFDVDQKVFLVTATLFFRKDQLCHMLYCFDMYREIFTGRWSLL